MIRNVLSIAGSDPSGGAGIQADLKTFAARGVYGMAVVTALTAQNTQGVSGVHLVPAAFVRDQIEAVLTDVRVDAIKIGMLGTAEIIHAVADALIPYSDVPLVLDPVMVAKGGSSLLRDDAVEALIERLIPMAAVLTPNLPEAAALLGEPEAGTRAMMASQGEALCAKGARAVLLKGGHLDGDECPDSLVSVAGVNWFSAPRFATPNTHGTGCTLSSALAAELSKGLPVEEAVLVAKAYVTAAIGQSGSLSVGTGHGPLQHFHALWGRLE
ncbi:bifunctional hydroxymethylpyrimidine kinase/phosphomethylpyrimidine kinase [Oryzifoliimicrobium ureilyticus]|uniref:bifunctional hydroxymethylpyrimidine kinase/phosphomethylpyrimidine kinase n=1 Tax=Oryzifoliimicrobium ureilyticus TaxID=3113724 RepID=UPI0030763755